MFEEFHPLKVYRFFQILNKIVLSEHLDMVLLVGQICFEITKCNIQQFKPKNEEAPNET